MQVYKSAASASFASDSPESSTVPGDAAPGSGAMFDAIVRRYDLLNRLMSFGMDQSWRRTAASALAIGAGARVLDVGTGTGDMALMVLDREPEANMEALDPSPAMLAKAERKIAAAGHSRCVRLSLGVAERLPFPGASFDGLTMAFGIRNVADRRRALSEMARVSRPEARIAILELVEPRRGIMALLARVHIRAIVPLLGALLSGAREYRYLQRSIAAFPPPEDFAEEMRAAGLDVLNVRPLTFGVVCLFLARPRPPAPPAGSTS